MMRIAVTDDWQRVARKCADWTTLQARADVQFFNEPFGSEDAAAAALAPFDAILVTRERTPFPRTLIDRLPAAAGSDAHVLPGIGTTLCGMDDFTGPDDFARALAESRIVRRPRSRLYLQSLKLLQTTMAGVSRGEGQVEPPA